MGADLYIPKLQAPLNAKWRPILIDMKAPGIKWLSLTVGAYVRGAQ